MKQFYPRLLAFMLVSTLSIVVWAYESSKPGTDIISHKLIADETEYLRDSYGHQWVETNNLQIMAIVQEQLYDQGIPFDTMVRDDQFTIDYDQMDYEPTVPEPWNN